MCSPTLRLCALFLLALARGIFADVPLPPNILEPRTPAEAWNIIRLTTANVDRLIAEDRPEEIATQISLCSPALRALAKANGRQEVQTLANRAGGWVAATASAGIEKNGVRAANSMKTLRAQLDELAKFFDPAAVKADIYVCPTHPIVTAEEPNIPCVNCGRPLVLRRLPYSFIYVPPGRPTLRLTAATDAPIEAGRATTVKLRLQHADGSPVRLTDLTPVHTQPLHVLLADPSLGDFHHEQPAATATPGEYTLTFTPSQTAPYRIWADAMPAATGAQELPFVDLASAGKAAPLKNAGDVFTTVAGGLTFTLAVGGGIHPRAKQACGLTLTVTDAAGQPLTQLEPLLGAFAHIAAIYEDYETVLHLHPVGTELTNPEARGGPAMRFTFYPPRAGCVRLFCIARVNGRKITAPLSLRVEP